MGLCIAGSYSGQIRGDFLGAATSITTTADTATTGVAMFTSDSTIDATVGGRSGTLVIKNAGAFAASGPIVDLQTIVGGTGELVGASGAPTRSRAPSPPPTEAGRSTKGRCALN